MSRKRKGRRSQPENLVIGRNSVREVLSCAPDRVRSLLVARGDEPEDKALIKQLARAGADIEHVTMQELDRICNSSSHQGFVARMKERPAYVLEDLPGFQSTQDRSLLIALDTIFDPHNFGAILRAAECYGVQGVLWSKNRGAGITPAVTRVSVGASEIVPLLPVSNLARTLEQCKQAKYWIVAADVGKGSVGLEKFEFPRRAVLVLGSEGKGLSRLSHEQADFRVHITMHGRIDSLNVSQAAAVFLHAAVAQSEG